MEPEFESLFSVSLREQAKSDIERFAKFHSWYKHLSYEGEDFLIFPWKGQQPRNVIDTKVEDEENLHWWVWRADFIDEIPVDGMGKDIIMRRPVRFNCFLRGLDGEEPHRHLRGMSVITNKKVYCDGDSQREVSGTEVGRGVRCSRIHSTDLRRCKYRQNHLQPHEEGLPRVDRSRPQR